MSDFFVENPTEMPSGDMRHADSRVTLRFERFASFVEEYSSNISLGGVFIKTHKARPVATDIHFEFKLVDGFRLLHGQGQVVWVRLKDRGEAAPAGMGVRFTAVDESGRQLVLKLLEEQVKSGGAPFEVETVPPDADASPAAHMAPTGLPDLSEDPTLIGHVPEVALPDSVSSAAGAAGDGFDAPWGENLPSIPNDLLDEENDPEVEEAVRSIRPDPKLAAKPPASAQSLEPEAEEISIPSVRAETAFDDPGGAVPKVVLSDYPPNPPAPPSAPEASAPEPTAAELSAPEPAVPAPTVSEPAVLEPIFALEGPEGSEGAAVEEPLAEPIFELETEPASKELDLLADDAPTLVKPAGDAVSFAENELVFEPPPEDELPFDPEIAAADPEPTLAPAAIEEAPAFELTGAGTDPSLDATDFTFVSKEEDQHEAAADVREIPAPIPQESWITSAAPLPPVEGAPALESPASERSSGFDASANAFDGPAAPSLESASASENSFEVPSFEVPAFEPPASAPEESSFSDLAFEEAAEEAPSFESSGLESGGEQVPAFELPALESPSFESSESSASAAADAAAELAYDPVSFADPEPAISAAAAFDIPGDGSAFALDEGVAAESAAFEMPPADLAGPEPPAESSPPDFAAQPPAPEVTQPPSLSFAEGAPATASDPSAAHTGLFANPSGDEALEATEEWPTTGNEEEEDWMRPEKASKRWLPLAAAALVVMALAGAYFFRQQLAGMVGLASGDSAEIAQGPPPSPVTRRPPAGQPAGQPAAETPGPASGENDDPQAPSSDGETTQASERPGTQGQPGDAAQSASARHGAAQNGAAQPGAAQPSSAKPPPQAQEVEAPPPPSRQAPARQASPRQASPRQASPRQAPPRQVQPRETQPIAASGSRARNVVDIEWQRQSTGTRVSIQFDGVVDASRYRHDQLAWAGDRERLVLNGIENFRLGAVAVGTPELQRIRIGHHPGQELHLVFDLANTNAGLMAISAAGNQLEILVQAR